MPPAHALPQTLTPVAARQAFSIRGETWTHDFELVQRELEPYLERRDTGRASSRSAVEEPASSFTADDFRAVALGFDSADMSARNATAEEIKEIAAFLPLGDVLAFCRSRKTAERVGAAVALGVHLRSSTQTREDRRALSALGELLTDGRSSLVRYRAAQVLRSSPGLVPTYADDLRHLAASDENSWVRDMAAEALRRARV